MKTVSTGLKLKIKIQNGGLFSYFVGTVGAIHDKMFNVVYKNDKGILTQEFFWLNSWLPVNQRKRNGLRFTLERFDNDDDRAQLDREAENRVASLGERFAERCRQYRQRSD